MAEQSDAPQQHSQPKLAQELVDAGQQAFDPSLDDESREVGLKSYNELLKRTETWALLPALNTLIKPGVLPAWLSKAFMQTLTFVPLRPDGVRGTMEFVFSVHPSSSSQAGPATPQKQGASITQEAVSIITRLLAAVPASMSADEWCEGIAAQMNPLMDGRDGSDLARTAARIVGFGFLGRKDLGAPGSPGWNVFVQPLLEAVNPSLRADKGLSDGKKEDDVVDLTRDRVLTTAEWLDTCLKRLRILVLSNPAPGLCKRLLKPILAQIWSLASWPGAPTTPDSPRGMARGLVGTYLRLFGKDDTMDTLLQNALCKGSPPGAEVPWEYRLLENGAMSAVAKRSTSADEASLNWVEVDERATGLADVVVQACSAEDVSMLFLKLLRQWIKTTGQSADINLPTAVKSEQGQDTSLRELFEVTLLQKLLDKAPEKLVSQFDQLLEVIVHVLEADGRLRMDDEVVGVVLSLLNMVVTTPTFQKSDISAGELAKVEASLGRLGGEDRGDVSQTASNLALLLKYRGDLDDEDDSKKAAAAAGPSKRQLEDQRTYNLAMGYVTGADSPPPVVSEGISLLAGLVTSGSPVVDVTAVKVLLSRLLASSEDYINLRVIKTFTQLAGRHPRSTVQELLEQYLDARERSTTDTRLRFGEALLQVVERLGETFTGDVARQVGETLASIAGRRGYRPKTLARQAREEKLREMKRRKREKAAERGEYIDGDDEDDDDVHMGGDDEDEDEEDKARNDALAQIVQGWESKRGAEDVRMRTSALSILGAAMEANLRGMGATLASGIVDLCVSVLTLEPEVEKGILRRAAVVTVLSFVRALDRARQHGSTGLGFGLTDASREDIARTLGYVAQTDNDGLVQQHARDVVESLENWQLGQLVPPAAGSHDDGGSGQTGLGGAGLGGGLGRLRGLAVNPDVSTRPRIEEIE